MLAELVFPLSTARILPGVSGSNVKGAKTFNSKRALIIAR
jgi:hypothetical protein